jgi:Tol biopolymer transport system component
MFSVSQTGVVAYRTSTVTELGWFDRAGHPLGWIGIVGRGLHPALSPALSPDGQRLAVSRFEAGTATSSIWILDLRYGSVGSRFTTTYPTWETCPVWSPDGSYIVFASGRADGGDLYEKSVNGTTEELALPHGLKGCPLDMSPDGRFLLFATPRDSPGNGLYRLPLDGDGAPTLLAGPWPVGPSKRGARISPDGRWLAYVSPASGRNEIYVRSFHDDAGTWQVSSHGGIEPQWRGDGRELFFIGADQQLMTAPVTTERGFRAGTPTALFLTGLESSGLPIAGRNQYVAARDGQRFLIDQPRPEAAGSPVTLLVNWRAALKR